MFFSKSTSEKRRHFIKNTLGVVEIQEYEKYWGLPSLVGRNKKASFNFIKELVQRKLQGWEEKLISQAGKEVLIKAVMQAIPTNTMNCFKFPIGLCNDIESLIHPNFGGDKEEIEEKSIRYNGRSFVN